MKFKKLIVIAIAFSLIIATSGCNQKNESENETINLGLMSDTAAIPIVVADALGFFKEENVTVNTHIFFSAVDRDSALQANELNSTSSDLISVGLLKEAGSSFQVISKTETEYKLLSSPEESNNTLDNFHNKKIGLSTNTLMEFLVDSTIEKYNLLDIEKVNIPKMPTRLEMLSNNQIHAAILPEPLASLSEQQGSKIFASNIDIDLFPGVLLFESNFLEDNPSTMESFKIAYNKAVDFINDNGIQDLGPQIKDKLSFSEEGFDTFKDIKFSYLSLPREDDISSAMNWLYQKELISKIYSFDELTYDFD
ncbi:hypothetical protein GC105_14005 [Alkalibaculum sp. M08DMB]|uniref:SsuA/THI5-like domain-containing protein n=1 Tax=Alkalibaculum sporogenes TaxID=2655001 RepID=A0A6A7KC08_9FIRM|nr:ABC transporter substrate-binding protein [Alkalibaculum sporogenes]MPW26895.1 hypothetical protein [Alkalibaculum sporogenes]